MNSHVETRLALKPPRIFVLLNFLVPACATVGTFYGFQLLFQPTTNAAEFLCAICTAIVIGFETSTSYVWRKVLIKYWGLPVIWTLCVILGFVIALYGNLSLIQMLPSYGVETEITSRTLLTGLFSALGSLPGAGAAVVTAIIIILTAMHSELPERAANLGFFNLGKSNPTPKTGKTAEHSEIPN